MSLLVSAYRRLPDGHLEWIDMPEPGAELAGFESTRKTFWGSTMAQRLGLRLVTELEHHDVYAEGDALAVLEHEIDILMKNLHLFPAHDGYWQQRLGNVKRAIEVARAISDGTGGVYIG